MLSSQSITRRFTPPTCTLEIEATSSSLSRWTTKKVIKDVQFQLSFDDPRLPEEQQVTIKGDRTQLEQLNQVVTSYVHNFLQQSSLEQIISSSSRSVSAIDATQPSLQPQGIVAHELFLGSLGDGNSVQKIKLSAVQLFDLITALEAYQVEIAVIPNLDSARRHKLPLWAGVAASIVLVVGLTTVSLRTINQSSTTSLQESESAFNQPKPKQDEVIPPQVTKSPQQPATQKKLQDPLSSAERLPPPPPVDLPKPPPANVPDPAQYPFPQPNQTPIVKPPNSQVIPKIAITPKPQEIPSNSASEKRDTNLTIDSEGDTSQVRNIPQIPDLPPLSPSLLPSETDVGNNSVAKGDNDGIEKEESIQTKEPVQSDTNSQLTEIENYFQQQWQPPAELKQTIEYRLVVSSNGSIIRIIPIGKASAIFLDRTNIPLMGEPFVTPTATTKGNQTIRLLLSPDGEVRAFLENK